MSEDNTFDLSQVDVKSSILDSQEQQLPSNSNGLRRRTRRPKRSIGCHIGSILEGHDHWYDAPYELLSSGCVTPMENNLSSSNLQSRIRPLPILLYERELHSRRGNERQYRRKNTSWIRQMLSDANDTDLDNKQTVQRSYYRQALKFSNLRTSMFDAVLGIEPNGNYVVAIGTTYVEDNYMLHLKLCGLPSCKNPKSSVAPLLMSIPLGETNPTSNIDTGDAMDYFMQIAPERYPLRIWLSTNERFGACMYRTNLSIQSKSANVVLFPLPKAISGAGDEYIMYQWNHVHVPCQSKQDISPINDCNLLLRVSCFPNNKIISSSTATTNRQHWLCHTVTSGIMAHLYLIDVEHGFRLAWIRESTLNEYTTPNQNITPLWFNLQTEAENNQTSHDCNHNGLPGIVRAGDNSRIVVPMTHDDFGWQPMICNTITGNCRVLTYENVTSTFTIAFASFFSVTSLLLDILTRRPHLVSPRFCGSSTNVPNFTYHLVHIHDGRVAEVLLVFAVGPIGRGCLGVFIEVDLFTQDYREIEWIKHPAHDSPPPTCAKLAFDRRRSQVGINSAHSKTSDNLLDLLFPDCVTMDNRAIRRHVPTMFMSARSSHVTISYL